MADLTPEIVRALLADHRRRPDLRGRLADVAPDLAAALLEAWETNRDLHRRVQEAEASAARAWCEEHSLESDLALAAVLASLVAGWDEARRRAAFYEDAAYSLLDHHKHGSDRDAEYARLVAGPGESHGQE